jgi:hypothetical protein
MAYHGLSDKRSREAVAIEWSATTLQSIKPVGELANRSWQVGQPLTARTRRKPAPKGGEIEYSGLSKYGSLMVRPARVTAVVCSMDCSRSCRRAFELDDRILALPICALWG